MTGKKIPTFSILFLAALVHLAYTTLNSTLSFRSLLSHQRDPEIGDQQHDGLTIHRNIHGQSLTESVVSLLYPSLPSKPTVDSRMYPISVLPDKVFTIVGLESSGTTFMAETIRHALQLKMIGSKNFYEAVGEGFTTKYLNNPTKQEYWTEVHHVSLPWGGINCREDPYTSIVPVIFPAICTKLMKDLMQYSRASLGRKARAKCPFASHHVSDLTLSTYQIPTDEKDFFFDQCKQLTNKNWEYPGRYSLNISSHLEWYKSRGVDTRVIIIMRDATISRRARQEHCSNSTLMAMEEELGMKILQEAIQKYVIPSTSRNTGPRRRRLLETSSDGKVILVSYELLNQLKFDYLSMIYNSLGIDSNYNPMWKDGNVKHVTTSSLTRKRIRAVASSTVSVETKVSIFQTNKNETIQSPNSIFPKR